MKSTTQSESNPRPRVVIIGAGFAGLHAARALAGAPVDVTLVDRNNYHMFQPLLYQIATAGLEPDEIVHPIRDLFRKKKNIQFNHATVRAIHKDLRQLEFEDGSSLSYDYLIIAAGSMTNYFGVPGAEEFAFPMKTVPAAMHIRNHILRQFEQAERFPELAERGALNVVIVGGGPTGVELAGQMVELFRHVMRDDYRNVDPAKARVILVEALPYVLAPYEDRLRQYARRVLEKRGVEVLTGKTVERVTYDAVYLKDAPPIPTQTVIWGAGVKGHPMAETLGIQLARGGRIPTSPDLSLPGHPEIFAVGDIGGPTHPEGKMYAQLATVAIQEGKHAARQIRRLSEGKPTEAFTYTDPGTMATIGRNAAIAQLAGGLKFTGFFAWLMWALLHIFKIVGFRNRVDVFFNWVYNYLTYDFNARLIMDVVPVRAAKKLDEAYGRKHVSDGQELHEEVKTF